jgi:hypothetical protein
MPLPCLAVPQGKLEPDARQALISKGQQLKAQLEQVEAQLVLVGVCGCVSVALCLCVCGCVDTGNTIRGLPAEQLCVRLCGCVYVAVCVGLHARWARAGCSLPQPRSGSSGGS